MPLDLNMRLSTNFTLKELIRTSHRTLDNTPPPIVVDRLQDLCVNFLEPIRLRFGAIRVNSGYRSPAVNAAVGGSAASAHMFGCAADIDAINPAIQPRDIVSWIVNESGLDYDQVIEEYTSTASWTHVGILRPGYELVPRHQALLFKGGKYFKWV